MKQSVCRRALVVTLCACAVGASAVEIEMVTIGNPGNAGESSGQAYGPDAIVGAVDYTYEIGKYEITAGQYTEFLNAVASADTYSLYETQMMGIHGCKILREGTAGSYRYSVAADRANRPVQWVNVWDAMRFANWMHNGQPVGAQGPGTTETGPYDLNGYMGNDGRDIRRNPGAIWAVPSENEWYKAAYHKNDGATGNYWEYPTGSDAVCDQGIPVDTGNSANIWVDGYAIGSPYWRSESGYYSLSPSPYGTYDQGGNVEEWNDTVVGLGSGYDAGWRGLRGGQYYGGAHLLRASYRYYNNPQVQGDLQGFRLVRLVPDTPPVPGDLNCDGAVNALDINPFVKAITNEAEYYEQFPLCDHVNGDINCDGAVNALDINPFVQCITGACPPCP